MSKNGSSERRANPGEDFTTSMAAFAGPGMDAALRASNAWLKGLGSLNGEVLSFSQQQFGKAIETGQSLMQCSSLDQAFDTQMTAARNALDSYYREANKILDLTNEMARDALSSERQPPRAAAE